MHLFRKIETLLNCWANGNKGLLIKGQRQVGKTYIIENSLKPLFKTFIKIDLATDKKMNELISTCKNANDFLDRLHLYFKFKEDDKETLIFIDEIQESYKYQESLKNKIYIDLITLSKEIISKNGIRLVFSGSLLGIEIFDTLNKVNSLPMGYLDILEMYPLDFEEYLLANNIEGEIIKKIEYSFLNKETIDSAIHNRIIELFNEYLLIGGMPDAVKSFIENRDLQQINNIHKQINEYILADISKYADLNNKLKIKEIYKILPSELNSQSKRFNLNDISNFKKDYNYQLSFTWLTNAGVAIPVFNTKEIKIPLAIDSNRNLLKLFHADVGLLTYLYFNAQIKEEILKGNINVNKGSIVENFVAQTLHANGFDNLYYYNNKRFGEVDFVIQHKSKVLPIEIKSGKDYKKHSALNNIVTNNKNIEDFYVFCNSNVNKNGKVTYFPIYMIMFIKNW